jgi:hypothetical protein
MDACSRKGRALSDTEAPLTLGDAGWLSAVIGEAIRAAGQAPRSALPIKLHKIDREVHQALWADGLLLGADTVPSSILTDSEPKAAFVQVVRHLLTEGAKLLATRAASQNDHRLIRWQLGAIIAGLVGELGVAVVLEDAVRQRELTPDDEQRLMAVAGHALARRAYLEGNPPDGLPLHAGVAVLESRAFLRFTAGQLRHDGPLRRRSVRYAERLSASKALFFELLVGVFAASETESAPKWPRVASQQLRALSLLPTDRRKARTALRSPRAPADLLAPVPRRLRGLLVEQLILAALLARRYTPAAQTLVRDAALANGLTALAVDSIEARSAAFLLKYANAALALATPGEHPMFLTALLSASESMHEAADGIAQELRDTGDLWLTLGRLAKGETLNEDERARMRTQLVDLAKVVPSLAIFAAPGGMLLLPLIVKLLPFDLRPTAFQSRAPRAPIDVKPETGHEAQ